MFKNLARHAYSVLPFSWREPAIFRQTLKFLADSESWSIDQITQYQLTSAQKIIQHAFTTVPGYASLFKKHGVTPAHLRTIEDIKLFPFITKEILRDQPQDFISSALAPSKLVYTTTGGATGVPFGFHWVRGYNIPMEKAFIFNLWKRVGYEVGEKTAVLRGSFIGQEQNNKYWHFEPLTNELKFSSYHLTDHLIPVYLEEIKKFNPRFIQAYPSAAAIVAKFLQDNPAVKPPILKGLFCGSENLFPGAREFIERYWQCPVYSWYGHTESAILAGQCEKSNEYHLCPQYGLTEVVDAQGQTLTQEGSVGELIGTGFYGWATPFIRYKTRDLAVIGKKQCHQCKRPHQLLERIEGRFQELVITSQGRLISMTAINMHTPIFDQVRQFQFIQERQGEIILKISKKPSYTDQDTHNIAQTISDKLGKDMKLLIVFSDQLEAAPSGKGRFLIQHLDLQSWPDQFQQ